MNILFPKADASEYHSSRSQLQSLLLTCQKDKYFGLVEIAYPGNEKLEIFFGDKHIVGAYALNDKGWRAVQPSEYQAEIQDKDCDVRILPLPLEGIRVGKVMIECEQTGQPATLPTSGLRTYLDQISRQPKTSFLHVRWAKAQAALVVPGNRLPIRGALFTSGEQILSGEKALGRATSWAEPSCEVSALENEHKSDACLEYYLHLYFTHFLDGLLNRYSELAAIGLVNIVAEAFNAEAKKQNWHIRCVDATILDEEIFQSPRAAFTAYQTLADICLAQFAAVLGTKLTQGIVQETLNASSQTGRELLQTYPFLRQEVVNA